MIEAPGFLTVREVAAMLRVSRQTVYRRVADGEIESVRVGWTIRIPERALRKLLGGTGERAAP